ncbi:hypothetical protein [Streptococcus suis]|uniref:hypothetical protein n=1 Tax=Streptococcus suis TaxID=1307 RepID=UPI001E38C1EF|nr:hypothetical protein [Streptococcus suis]
MTEVIFTLGIFAVPILTAAVVEQRKIEKKSKCVKNSKKFGAETTCTALKRAWGIRVPVTSKKLVTG